MNARFAPIIMFSLLAGLTIPQSPAVADISRSNLIPIARELSRDFRVVNSMRTIEMGESEGRTDLVVIGGSERSDGWRAEVLSADRHDIKKIWDSETSAREQEFGNSGPGNIELLVERANYKLIIEGCAPHECSDGIFGFLIFSGETGRTSKAKVTAHVLQDKVHGVGQLQYEVTYSAGTNAEEMRALQKLICNSGSNQISKKAELPFSCAKM